MSCKLPPLTTVRKPVTYSKASPRRVAPEYRASFVLKILTSERIQQNQSNRQNPYKFSIYEPKAGKPSEQRAL